MANGSLSHYGTPRHSGRYPWGSGKNAQERSKSFFGYVKDLKNKGMSDVDIAKGMGLTLEKFRSKKTIVKEEARIEAASIALKLRDKGMSNVAIGKQMGRNESSVRALLDPVLRQRSEVTSEIAKKLRDNIEEKKYIDIGAGVERYMGVSRTHLKTAVSKLEDEGYKVHYILAEQMGTGKRTTNMVLTKGDVPYSEVSQNRHLIKTVNDYSVDGGKTFNISDLGLKPIRSISSKDILIKYGDEGGSAKDGVIELRRGVDNLSLGKAKYAQVRIGVDGTHYMKGMAIYNDDIPKGYNIIYNTNKPKGTDPKEVFKKMKDDPDNPFGATVRQVEYTDKHGKTQLSSLNILNQEGDWGDWSKTISSQFLSKQSPKIAQRQLDLSYKIKKDEYDEIMSLTNPTVKKKLLDGFASDCDAAAVHLKAAALPRQGTHAILPIPTMKENEVYAPNYRNGESVVLIRYPHGGTFEIPELKVNNKHRDAIAVMGQAKDAVGINHKVAEKLSGADFDGDFVLVIPNRNREIKTSSTLKGLKDFDPKESYKLPNDAPKMTSRQKGQKMGEVSNLITDMTIKGATHDELARAVRHSMVVIDAEKHHLDYKKSAIDNGIAQLKVKYQGSARSGASTLISRSSSEQRVGIRKEKIDPETGKKVYTYTNETYTKYATSIDPKTGKKVYDYNKPIGIFERTSKSTKMYETPDAFKLSSGTPMETVYASHANRLKSLANEARVNYFKTPNLVYSSSAKQTYAKEVSSLMSQLNIALKNAPLERQAHLLAKSVVDAKKAANPYMEESEIKKLRGQALTAARARTGAKKKTIDISPKEWEAIQAGAISNNQLIKILNNTNMDKIKQLATPRVSLTLTQAKQDKAKAMLASGYTQSEVAEAIGVSTSTITKLIN